MQGGTHVCVNGALWAHQGAKEMLISRKPHVPCICHHRGMLHLGGKRGLVGEGRTLVGFLEAGLLAIPCLENSDSGGERKGVGEGACGLDGDAGHNPRFLASERPKMGRIGTVRVNTNLKSVSTT
jgi:hypothetical protein